MTIRRVDKAAALFGHCVETYNAMAEAATLQSGGEDGDDVLVYEGFLTKLFRDTLHLAVPYYSHVMRCLKAMDCVRQLRRGGSTTPSRWALLQPPTSENYEQIRVQTQIVPAAQAARDQQIRDMRQQITDLERRVYGYDSNHSGASTAVPEMP